MNESERMQQLMGLTEANQIKDEHWKALDSNTKGWSASHKMLWDWIKKGEVDFKEFSAILRSRRI